MYKKLTKPFVKNDRLDEPYGLLGVPPDAPGADDFTVLTDKVILIVDRPTALRLLGQRRDMEVPPS